MKLLIVMESENLAKVMDCVTCHAPPPPVGINQIHVINTNIRKLSISLESPRFPTFLKEIFCTTWHSTLVHSNRRNGQFTAALMTRH